MTEIKLGKKRPLGKAPKLADKTKKASTGWSPSAWRATKKTS